MKSVVKMGHFYGAILILSLLSTVKSTRILCIVPANSISHHYVYRGLFDGLARYGHQFVVVTPDPQSADLLHDNIEEVDIRNYSYDTWKKDTNLSSILDKKKRPIDFYETALRDRDNKQKEFNNSSPRVKEILGNYGENFDLLIHESYYDNLMYHTHHLEASIVGSATAFFPMEIYRIFEMPYNPLFYADMYATYYDLTSGNGDLSFSDKVIVLSSFLKQMSYYGVFLERSERFGKTLADIDLEDLIRKKSVHFITMSHFDNGNRPVTEKVKFLGDLSTNRKLMYEDIITEDIMAKMNSSTGGIIYFSLGNNVRFEDLANKEVELFKSVFKELNQFLIFWKWDSEVMDDQPNNVIILKKFPQFSILKHPNTKLLITHGGKQSMDEALVAEIPVIVIPIWLDQHSHAHNARKAGLGRVIDLYAVTKEEFKGHILEVINNPEYKKNIIKHKKIINDVPQKGLEIASFWIDYVLRHKNTKHFDPEPSDFITLFWIDVFAFLVTTVACVTAVFYVSCKISRSVMRKAAVLLNH